MAIISTVGSASANSYTSLATANLFFENWLKPNAWDSAVPNDQERALMTATNWLEEFGYVGRAATTTQALKWPRYGLSDVTSGDDELILGLYDETEMPTPLIHAHCQLAYYLLTLGESAATALATGIGAVSSLKIGNSVEVKYQQPGTSSTSSTSGPMVDPTGLPIHVARLLRGLRLPVVIA